MATRNEQLAWAAGFFDGEGNCWSGVRRSYRKYKQRAIVVQISQVDKRALSKFKRILGIGSISGPHKTRRNWSPAYRWSTTGWPGADEIYKALKPWLGKAKQEQFVAARKRYKTLASKKSRGLS